MAQTELVTIEKPQPDLAIVTLNRPDAMNALSVALRQALHDAFRQLEKDKVRVAILTGAGRAFCAGLDLKELGQDASNLGSKDSGDPVEAMRDFTGVIVGAVNGAAITGGFEIALASDILIASEKAFFIDTHAHVGVIPGWGLSQILSRVVGPYRARQISLTAQRVPAGLAEKWGLVSEVVSSESLLGRAREIADQALATPEDMQRNYHRLIDEGFELSFADAMKLEAATSRARNSEVDAAQVEARRHSIQQRNRGD